MPDSQILSRLKAHLLALRADPERLERLRDLRECRGYPDFLLLLGFLKDEIEASYSHARVTDSELRFAFAQKQAIDMTASLLDAEITRMEKNIHTVHKEIQRVQRVEVETQEQKEISNDRANLSGFFGKRPWEKERTPVIAVDGKEPTDSIGSGELGLPPPEWGSGNDLSGDGKVAPPEFTEPVSTPAPRAKRPYHRRAKIKIETTGTSES